MRRKTLRDGVPSLAELKASPGYPCRDELAGRALAIIECIEEIPCDPCVSSCPTGAIEMPDGLHGLPRLVAERCNGCGLCLSRCPGQAIFLVDPGFSPEEATVSFVHEFFPLPKTGTEVEAVDREGKSLCRAKVVRVQRSKRNDRSPVVTLAVPKETADRVRGMVRQS